MSKSTSVRLAQIGFLTPLAALLLTKLWFDCAITARTFYTMDDYYIESPRQWQQLGLGNQRWVELGLLPALLCGLYGLSLIISALSHREEPLIVPGAWSLLLALAIAFLYQVATF